ncbi:MAG: IS110 family transposase [Eubacteriaceae bacterium]|nr:IS110 family transposase [Eubacteriaceae bacterium]
MNYTEQSAAKKIESISPGTLVVGIGIAKASHCAQFVDYRGIVVAEKAFFANSREGFCIILSKIEEASKANGLKKVLAAFEPAGHYWKTLAFWLNSEGIRCVFVNPYHTKQAKELSDNSQTKSGPKDALVIARLANGGNFLEMRAPEGVYASLRRLDSALEVVEKEQTALKNRITALMDEYFPEFFEVSKKPYGGKAAMQILAECPLPRQILCLGVDGVLEAVRKAAKAGVGAGKAARLFEAAGASIGSKHAQSEAAFEISLMAGRLVLADGSGAKILERMEAALEECLYASFLLEIKGLGVATAGAIIGGAGNLAGFGSPRQIERLAGINLREESSGARKGETRISKRGRAGLRKALWNAVEPMGIWDPGFKGLYQYYKTRAENPLRHKQAMVALMRKLLAILHALAVKCESYGPGIAFKNIGNEKNAA